MTSSAGCKRLIEVDLPIGRISEQARREKSIRHGHISTLHQWWARRPLAACRSVLLATLWPDPGDPACPERFRHEASRQMQMVRDRLGRPQRDWSNPIDVREALLDFIGLFANWDVSVDPDFISVARHLVREAHESLGGASGSRPIVLDPFAGGGAIPLEALRVGAEAFASDLNPVAILLNKVVLEYVPTYGSRLADEVERWGRSIVESAKRDIGRFYPAADDKRAPVAYVWARTARCEGPSCGAVVPMIRSLWLARKRDRSAALVMKLNKKAKTISFDVATNVRERDLQPGTVKRGALTCPFCDFTTTADRVRTQYKGRRGGTNDAQLLAVVTDVPGQDGRSYRAATEVDREGVRLAAQKLERLKKGRCLVAC